MEKWAQALLKEDIFTLDQLPNPKSGARKKVTFPVVLRVPFIKGGHGF